MCGIAGLAGFKNDDLLRNMCRAMVHRGPDDRGFFLSESHSLGIQRLSIIDIEGGHQPIQTPDGKVAVVFNGEIYNFRELKRELEAKGHSFKTRSDTEVIHQGYLAWGISVLDKLIGMFTLAISDLRKEPVLFLARDRLGVKPLYYTLHQDKLLFASEMKCLLEADLPRSFSPHAIHHYLKFRYVPGSECLISGIQKLPAGHWLRFEKSQASLNRYWNPPQPFPRNRTNFGDALDELESRLETSVRRRMIADVPVGAYLSGGLDSSLVVALMAKTHSGPIDTFSIGFDHPEDEIHLSRQTARRFGTRHHEVFCGENDLEKIDTIAWHLDEPVGDAIVLPMYLLAQEARKKVKVVLSGEGADEIFGGYLFHKSILAVNRLKSFLPSFAFRGLTQLLRAIPHAALNLFFSYPADLGRQGKEKLVNFLHQASRLSLQSQYRNLISLFSDTELQEGYTDDFKSVLAKTPDFLTDEENSSGSILHRLLDAQYRDWLPDDILMKLDKMTMAHSLEGREPYMDHELVEFVGSLPDDFKIRRWTDKFILRRLGEKMLPSDIARRPKKPFYIPIDRYFSSLAFKRLFERLRDEAFLRPFFKKDFLEKFTLTGKGLLDSKKVFSLIMLNAWMGRFSKQEAS